MFVRYWNRLSKERNESLQVCKRHVDVALRDTVQWIGSGRLMAGLDDLRDVFQPK